MKNPSSESFLFFCISKGLVKIHEPTPVLVFHSELMNLSTQISCLASRPRLAVSARLGEFLIHGARLRQKQLNCVLFGAQITFPDLFMFLLEGPRPFWAFFL